MRRDMRSRAAPDHRAFFQNAAHASSDRLSNDGIRRQDDRAFHPQPFCGGFHRYSVDRYWHVPHFEKMLYDQAQLASAYLDALQITNDPHLNLLPGQGEEAAKRQVRVEFEAVARDILDYVARDMTAKEGGFFSAE